MDCSPPGSSVQEILQARKLEWVTIPFSRGSGRDVTKGYLSRVCSSSCPLSWCRYLTMSSPAALFSFCLQSFPAFNNAFNISQGNVCVFVCVYMYISLLLLVARSCPTLLQPVDCIPPGSSVHGISQARILEWVAFPSPGDLPDPGTEPESSSLQADSLPLSHWGCPMYTCIYIHTCIFTYRYVYKYICMNKWVTLLYTWNYHNTKSTVLQFFSKPLLRCCGHTCPLCYLIG